MNRRQPPRRHACVRCVELKVRCDLAVNSSTCERCHRLGRSCVFPDNVHARRPRRSRVDDLEKKVDNLVSQLGKTYDNSCTQSLEDRSSSVASSSHSSVAQERSTTRSEAADGFISKGSLTVQEADELLNKFREHKMHQFPFVIIPKGMNASDLWRKSPFLLLCILTACLEHNPVLQDILEREVREHISTYLIMEMRRDMDLLQGLLVHTAWYHYHWRTYHTQAYMLLQMALMVVVDLGLDKDENFKMQAIPPDGRQPDQVQRHGDHQSLAGQRALLGCYYLCSKLSIFRRQLVMRYTNWIDQCVRNLAARAEYPTDSNIMAYLGAQSLVRQTQVMLEEGLGDHLIHSRQVAWERVFELLEKQKIEERLLQCQGSKNIWSLQFELNATHLLVLGYSLRRQRDVFYLFEKGQLQAITSSAHRVVATFLSAPSSVAVHLPTTSYTILWYGLLVLSKLSLLFPSHAAEPLGVDNQKIRYVGIAIMQKIGSLSQGGDVWENSKKVIGSMLSWLERSKLETRQMASDKSGSTVLTGNASNNTGYCVSFNQGGDFPTLGESGNVYNHQEAWPSIDFSNHLTSAADIEAQAAVDWDAGLWQEMLESVTWSGMPIDSPSGFA